MTDERTARILELRAQGLGWKRVARETGIPATTCRRLGDPAFAERQRRASAAAKRRRTGTCEECGGTTRYNGTKGKGVSRLCADCGARHGRDYQKALTGMGPTQQRVRALLVVRGEMRWAEIRDAFGWSDGGTGRRLDRYTALGIIKRTGRGRYMAVTE